jgi:hypothetical protein
MKHVISSALSALLLLAAFPEAGRAQNSTITDLRESEVSSAAHRRHGGTASRSLSRASDFRLHPISRLPFWTAAGSFAHLL